MKGITLLTAVMAVSAISAMATPALAMRDVGGPAGPNADGMSLYQYVRSAPPNYVDSNGRAAQVTAGVASQSTGSPKKGPQGGQPPAQPDILPEDIGDKPETQCKLNGVPVSMVFNGQTVAGNGHTWPAVSGRPVSEKTERGSDVRNGGYVHHIETTAYALDYSKERQKDNFAGPAKEGKYWIDTSCTNSRENAWRHSPWNVVSHGAWGDYSWHLYPYETNDMSGTKGTRGKLFLHGGDTPGSAGCIDLMGNDKSFKRDIIDEVAKTLKAKERCYIDIEVTYPEKAFSFPVSKEVSSLATPLGY